MTHHRRRSTLNSSEAKQSSGDGGAATKSATEAPANSQPVVQSRLDRQDDGSAGEEEGDGEEESKQQTGAPPRRFSEDDLSPGVTYSSSGGPMEALAPPPSRYPTPAYLIASPGVEAVAQNVGKKALMDVRTRDGTQVFHFRCHLLLLPSCTAP